MKLTFLGGVGTVTGSKYLLDTGSRKILVDCGLFQGYKELRLRNWSPLPFSASEIDAVVLTHAHLDHSGYVPLLVRNGFRGKVFASAATLDLCKILLRDSGHLMEREAEFANRHRYAKHKPALPLYTERDAESALESFSPCAFGRGYKLGTDLELRFYPAGHILGSSLVRLTSDDGSILFSGDLGRPHSATMVDPSIVEQADWLVVESTYGNRKHDEADPEDVLADVVSRTAARGGVVVVPAFAVGRAQSILYHLQRLKSEGRIPNLPIFLDSPMAINASEVFCGHVNEHRLSELECRAMCEGAIYVRSAEDSKALDQTLMPMVLISASGMATGGRVLHHLKHFAPDRRNAILFTGFQASGTRGASLVGGATQVKIHGQNIPIRAEVHNLHMLSAHADADEILEWLGNFREPPKTTFITHGEPTASSELRRRIETEMKWRCVVPAYEDVAELL